jgi:predicted nucleic acid-binding protein
MLISEVKQELDQYIAGGFRLSEELYIHTLHLAEEE